MSHEAALRALVASIRGASPSTDASALDITGIYPELVRKRFQGMLTAAMPRTAARLGPSRLAAEVDLFLRHGRVTPASLRAVVPAFLRWAEARWKSDSEISAYLHDLARFEESMVEVASAEDAPIPVCLPTIAGERPLVFAPTTRIMAFAYGVHGIADDETARDEPLRAPTTLVVYRDEQGDAQCLSVDSVTSEVLQRLLPGCQSLGTAVVAACVALGCERTPELMASIACTLTELGRRGVLLGSLGEARREADQKGGTERTKSRPPCE